MDQQPQTNQPAPEQKTPAVSSWLLVVFLIVLVGGGGYLAWYYFIK